MTRNKSALIITACLSLILIWLIYPRLQNTAALESLINDLGWKGVILDLLIIACQMLFPIVPFSLLAGINIILFGPIVGYLISLAGSLLGSSIGFGLARFLGKEWAKPKIQKLGYLAELPESRSFYLVLIGRMIPVLPSAALNYAAGLSSMKFRSFLLATLLGKIPMIAWESLIGHNFWYIFKHPLRFFKSLIPGILMFSITSLLWYRAELKLKLKNKV